MVPVKKQNLKKKKKTEMLLELSSEFVLSGLREPVYFITLAFKENSSFADLC